MTERAAKERLALEQIDKRRLRLIEQKESIERQLKVIEDFDNDVFFMHGFPSDALIKLDAAA